MKAFAQKGLLLRGRSQVMSLIISYYIMISSPTIWKLHPRSWETGNYEVRLGNYSQYIFQKANFIISNDFTILKTRDLIMSDIEINELKFLEIVLKL